MRPALPFRTFRARYPQALGAQSLPDRAESSGGPRFPARGPADRDRAAGSGMARLVGHARHPAPYGLSGRDGVLPARLPAPLFGDDPAGRAALVPDPGGARPRPDDRA